MIFWVCKVFMMPIILRLMNILSVFFVLSEYFNTFAAS